MTLPFLSSETPPATLRDRLVLHALMAAHTAIVAFSFAAGPILIRGALNGAYGFWFFAALAGPPFVCALRALNGRECILQTWARRLRGLKTGWARDVYFVSQDWAFRVVMMGAASYGVGLAGAAILSLQ